MTAETTFKHDRVSFRFTGEEDLDLVLKMERDAENTPFIRQYPRSQHVSAIKDTNMAHFVIQSDLGKIVGYVIMAGVMSPDNNVEFRRIVINEKGTGLGRESVKLIKKIAFEHFGAHRLWLDVVETNQRAYHIYESEGFIYEGTSRESFKQHDGYLSIKVMSILDREYRALENEAT